MSIDDGSSYPLGTISEVGPVLKVSSSDWNDHWERPVSHRFISISNILPIFAEFVADFILELTKIFCLMSAAMFCP